MTAESQKILTANMLAQEKMNEVILYVESEGFQEQDINEEGDFSNGLYGDYAGGGLDGTFEDFNEEQYADYKWAYTVREVEIALSGDMSSMMGTLGGSGLAGEPEQSDALQSNLDDQSLDLGDAGISDDMITEQLSPFVREVRVVVWWGEAEPEDEDNLDRVELTTHLINPNGDVVTGSQNNPAGGGSVR